MDVSRGIDYSRSQYSLSPISIGNVKVYMYWIWIGKVGHEHDIELGKREHFDIETCLKHWIAFDYLRRKDRYPLYEIVDNPLWLD